MSPVAAQKHKPTSHGVSLQSVMGLGPCIRLHVSRTLSVHSWVLLAAATLSLASTLVASPVAAVPTTPHGVVCRAANIRALVAGTHLLWGCAITATRARHLAPLLPSTICGPQLGRSCSEVDFRIAHSGPDRKREVAHTAECKGGEPHGQRRSGAA